MVKKRFGNWNKKAEYSRSFLRDKKADERVLSIYLFIIYIIVLIGIVSGVLLVYGSALDVRKVEAEVLVDKTIECFAEQGELVIEVSETGLNKCNFDFQDNTEKYMGAEQMVVSIEKFDFDKCNKVDGRLICGDVIAKVSKGRTEFLEYCNLEGKKLTQCVAKEVYLLEKNKGILLRIKGAVGKNELNK